MWQVKLVFRLKLFATYNPSQKSLRRLKMNAWILTTLIWPGVERPSFFTGNVV